ncbi:MAG TPA: LysR family transcriptional regulator [Acidimicrobiales bacterium]|nr:LysR family transcriptional regulator [Acidimicrobiales bacterium]
MPTSSRLTGRRLEYFVAVADHGSFTAAARTLFVSQPALSLSVKELETELGTELFHRLGRQVVLTAAGAALLGPARQSLRDVETGRAAVAAVLGLTAGTLSLGCLPTLAADPLAAMIGRFRRLHPGIRIDLAAPEDSVDLLDLLRSGRCELGIAVADDRPGDLEGRVLCTQELLAIHPPGTPASVAKEALGGLANVPLVATPVGTSTRGMLDDAFAAAGAVPAVAVVTAQRDAMLPLVLAGAGAALLPEPLATEAARLGAVVGRPSPPVTRAVSILHRPGPLAPAARRFLQLAG